ncbi:MAG TPA: uracil-DNA glycosylase [Clostridiaceae bacterium]|nr:uracil-DNA glycosylase [Clostridiaceae bacterium]
MMDDNINCFKCKYYFVTWDKHHPRGCRLFGFKGTIMPSVTVKASSGQPCRGFSPKQSDSRNE